MTDFTFLFNRKGALYPIDYNSLNNNNNISNIANEWPYYYKSTTLVQLCCKVIVADSTLTNKIVDIIPSELFVPLFKAALYPVKDVAIDVLINKWPHKSLILSRYAKNMFTSLQLLHNELEICQRTRLGVKYSADIVHSFIEALRRRQTKLRYLDLTDFPIAEIIIKYVATHCRLAQKEHQRNCLIDEYLQNVSDLEQLCEKPTTVRNDLKKTTSLPDEPLIFRFDCMLQERTTFEELMGALNSNINNRFHLQIKKLDLLCLGKGNIIKLLNKLDKEYIEGVRLQYNSITEESIKDIIPLLSQLRNLKALDLSCNLIDYRQNAESCKMMSDAFNELKYLNRLDLSGSPLGGCLSMLLTHINLPLEYLGLHSCGLLDNDLNYLTTSKHSIVKHLDLSENRLTRFTDSLINLLKICSTTLNAIELDDNRFDCIDYLNIICMARKMKNLKYLTTKGTFETNDHLLGSQFLQQSTSLAAWRISYPIDIYDPNSNDMEAQDNEKTLFIQRTFGQSEVTFKYAIDSFDFLTKKVNVCCKDLEPWQIVLYSVSASLIASYLYNFYNEIDTDLVTYFKKVGFRIAKKIPYVNDKIKSELAKTQETLQGEILKANKGFDYVRELPIKGLSQAEIEKQLESYLKLGDNKWRDGACSGCVYGADDELTELNTNVFKKFSWTNVMHVDVFPDVRKMEAEVVRMVCRMFNGDDQTCGTMTSGGTESLLLACKAARELASKRGIKRPEMVIPVTAHAAFDKAAHYFNIRIHHVPVDAVTKRAIPKLMAKYINSNTCLLVGSAPGFPHGVIDPIEEIGELGVKYNIPVHVDGCLGGFLIAFMEEAGFSMPCKFDFRVPGVTSISCDTHKYGFTPKGSSVIIYRNRNYRENQFFSCTDWPGGIYASPTIAGSRPGVSMAMTWATMMHIGREGYVESTKKICDVARYIESEIKKIKELRLMAEVDVSIVAFDSDQFNILKILDEISHTWHLNALQNPPGIHISVTKLQTKPGVAERFVKDLKDAVDRIMKQPDRKLGKIAQIYCSSQNVPDRTIIADVSYIFLDACYDTNLKPNGKVENN